jgi:DNA-binding transcriptional regulator GbsR (MarR family)
MADAYEAAKDEFIGCLERIGNTYSYSPVTKRIYGTLAISPRPLSLDEISKSVHAAKSGVSTNIRMMERMGMVRKVWVKGDRKDYYEADIDITGIYLRFFRSMLDNGFKEFFETVERCINMLKSGVEEKNREDAAIVEKKMMEIAGTREVIYNIVKHFISDLENFKHKEAESE